MKYIPLRASYRQNWIIDASIFENPEAALIAKPLMRKSLAGLHYKESDSLWIALPLSEIWKQCKSQYDSESEAILYLIKKPMILNQHDLSKGRAPIAVLECDDTGKNLLSIILHDLGTLTEKSTANKITFSKPIPIAQLKPAGKKNTMEDEMSILTCNK